MAALSLAVAGKPAEAIAAGAASPYINEAIKHITENTDNKALEALNVPLHILWGAVEAELAGGSAKAGAVAAGVGEIGARVLAETVYGKQPNELNEEEKQNLLNASKALAGIAATGASGGNGAEVLANISVGMTVAENAVENNLLLTDYSNLKGLTQSENEEHRKTIQLLKDNGIENIDDYAKIYENCSSEQCRKETLDKLNKSFDKAYDKIDELAKSGQLTSNDIAAIDEYVVRVRSAYDSKRFSEIDTNQIYFSGVINVLGKNEDRLNQARLYATVSDWASQGYSQEQIEEKLEEQNFAISMSSSGISLSSNTERGGIGKKPTVTSHQISKIIQSVQANIHLTLSNALARLKDRVRNEVSVYRVEGVPNQRLIISNAGDVFIIGNKTLYLNFGSKKRALEYLQQKIEKGLPNAELKSFVVPREYRDILKEIAVPEKDIRALDPDRVRPVIADPTKAKYQYGLREGQIEELKHKIILGSGKNGNFINAISEERLRLLQNSYPEYATGLGKNFVIKCNNNAKEVMDLSREVLLIINKEYDKYSKETWNKPEYWKYKLPSKFVDGFEVNNKIKHWWDFLKKSDKENWSLENWIFLMEPIDRMWFWWGATLIEGMEKDYFLFSATVLDDPFLSGTLRWLFLASGALEVIDEDDL